MRELRELEYSGDGFQLIIKKWHNKWLFFRATRSISKKLWWAVYDASRPPAKAKKSNDDNTGNDDDGEEAMARICAYYGYTPAQILDMTMGDFNYLTDCWVKLMQQDIAFISMAVHSQVDLPKSKSTKPIISHVPKLTDSQLEFLTGNA